MIDPVNLEKINAILEKVYSRIEKKKVDLVLPTVTKTEVSNLEAEFCLGDRVKLISCEKKHLNKEGEIIKVGRKNYHVQLSGLKNPLYLNAEQIIKI